MIQGSARVIRPNSSNQAVCFRCGIDFSPGKEHMETWAPCRDCRDALRAEGGTRVWDVRRRKQEAA